MNAIGSSFENEDLELIKKKSGIHGIVIPKVSSVNDLEVVYNGINGRNFDLYPCIESAKGLLNIKEILKDSRIKGVFFAAEDYCADAVRKFIVIIGIIKNCRKKRTIIS
jgi:citrate lyase beta subunit